MHEKDLRCLVFSTFSTQAEDLQLSEDIESFANLMFQGISNFKMSVRYVGPIVGFGLFAEEYVVCGGFIGEYVGVVRESSNSRRDDDGDSKAYTFLYPSAENNYDIDAKEYGNIIRFINHDSQHCNAEFRRIYFEGLMHIVCFALCDIEPNEQIKVDYGAAYWVNNSIKPLPLH
jgi:SET domain-containing protein